jgi:tRNA pseudouridine13 synthase
MAVPRTQRRFFVTAFQSAVFNHIVDDRIDRGLIGTLRDGDIACKHVNGAMFKIGDEELLDPHTTERLNRLEISPSGPLWGYQMLTARGEIARIEQQALESTGVYIDQFDTPPHDVRGIRRPLRIPVLDPAVDSGADEHGPYIQLRFQLPRGSFATTILREIMKTDDRTYPWGSDRYGDEMLSDT